MKERNDKNILKFIKLVTGTGKNGKVYHKATLRVDGEWATVFLFPNQVETLTPLFIKVEDKR